MSILSRKDLIGYEVRQQDYITIFTKSIACGAYHILGYLIDIECPILETFITKDNLNYCLSKLQESFK